MTFQNFTGLMLMLLLTFSLYTFKRAISRSFFSLWGQSFGQFKTKNTFFAQIGFGFQRKDKIYPFKKDQGIIALDFQCFLRDKTAENWKTVTPFFQSITNFITNQNIRKLH